MRNTRPNLWLLIMFYTGIFGALALNFFTSTPTFPVYDQPNWVWGSVFAFLSVTQAVGLLFDSMVPIRALCMVTLPFLLLFAVGTSMPFWDGNGSLQLPIMYVGLAILKYPILRELFVVREEDA